MVVGKDVVNRFWPPTRYKGSPVERVSSTWLSFEGNFSPTPSKGPPQVRSSFTGNLLFYPERWQQLPIYLCDFNRVSTSLVWWTPWTTGVTSETVYTLRICGCIYSGFLHNVTFSCVGCGSFHESVYWVEEINILKLMKLLLWEVTIRTLGQNIWTR